MFFCELRVKDILGIVRYRPNIQRWVARSRKHHIIGIQLTGSALHVMENQKFTINGGFVYFLNQKDDFRVEVYESTEAFSIHFTTYEDIETDSFTFPISNMNSVLSLLQKAESARASGNELALRAIFYEVCEVIQKASGRSYAKNDERIVLAKEYIDAHFTDADCLLRATERSGLGKRRFRDLFSSLFDITPSRYITHKRIELAQNLLSVGGLSVAEVSCRSGFSDVYYFSKVFKSEVGISPGRWNV